MHRSLHKILMVAAAIGLAACGASADSAEGEEVVEESAAASTASTQAPDTSEPETSESETSEGEATEVTIEHYSGTDTVPVDPQTVVVMDTGVLLTLDALGIEVDAYGSLGVPAPDVYADVVDNPAFAPVGTAFEPDYEAINALEPDLIIVATRSSSTYPDMSAIAPTVDLTLSADVDYVTAFRQRHEVIGQIFGIEAEVEAAMAEIEAEIDRVRALTGDAGDALILLANGAEISAYGPGSRFGMVHDVFGYGAANLSLEAEATHGDVVSFEFISEAAPDALFVVDRSAAIGQDGETAAQVLDNELVTTTPAWVNDRVVYVDGFSWYIAGDSIPAMHAIVADIEASLP